MNGQTNLFTGPELRDKGIKKAVDHAGVEWSDEAYLHLCVYIDIIGSYLPDDREFMMEDARAAIKGKLPPPPSLRAWGGIIRRAANAGLIEKVGIRQVQNQKAHCANANVWKVL